MEENRNLDDIARELAGGMSLEQLRAAQDRPKMAAEAPDMSPEERAYWDRVFAQAERKKAPTGLVRNHTPVMDYDTAKARAWAFFKARAYELRAIKGEPEFWWQFTDEQREVVANLIRYFVNDPACPWSLTKGVFLYGSLGVGKTEIMRILSRWAENEGIPKLFHFVSLSQVYDRAQTDKEYDPIQENVQFDRCFDEIGFKTGTVNRFGNDIDITETILAQRYDRNRRYGQITHIISNLDTNDLIKAISPRIFDRLHELCTGVRYPGKSHRSGQ
jgi:hypothetical protein